MLPTVAERAACLGRRAGDLAKKMTKGGPRGVVGGRREPGQREATGP